MGHVFDFQEALGCENRANLPGNQAVLKAKMGLLLGLAKPEQGETVLDIGCGTGRDLLALVQKNLVATGLDPSSYMLESARKRLPENAALYRGFGEQLPFADDRFDMVWLNSTLEFVDDPLQVLAEAARVAKDRLVIGFTNRYALTGARQRVYALWPEPVRQKARPFSPFEVTSLIHGYLGPAPVTWRTTCHFPLFLRRFLPFVEGSRFFSHSPCGAFVGMVVPLTGLSQALPLRLKAFKNETSRSMATGLSKR